jgi:antitoxin (DNA-binding transcriptional repressor) of toxin-antitoxin stability system
MDDVNLAHAKDHLEELMARAASGEDVRITDPKLGTVKLLRVPREPDLTAPRVTDTMEPFVPLKEKRVPGLLKGRLTIPDGIFDPMSDEELKDWDGGDGL